MEKNIKRNIENILMLGYILGIVICSIIAIVCVRTKIIYNIGILPLAISWCIVMIMLVRNLNKIVQRKINKRKLFINKKGTKVEAKVVNIKTTVLDDEGVRTAITAEVEQDYLFKKNTPVVSWVEVKENNASDKRYILYAAMQERVVDILTQIFNELGATLVAIENTYSSLMKTLEYTEVSKDFSMSHSAWNILLVSANSYAVFSMLENSVIEYVEEPLAIKSFSNDEVYVAIAQAAGRILEKFPTDKLLIISGL